MSTAPLVCAFAQGNWQSAAASTQVSADNSEAIATLVSSLILTRIRIAFMLRKVSLHERLPVVVGVFSSVAR